MSLPTRSPALKVSSPSAQRVRLSAVLTDRSPTAAVEANDRSRGMYRRSFHRRSGTATTRTRTSESVTDKPGFAADAAAGISTETTTATAATPARTEPVRVTGYN